ncbi:hypothetical protein RB195_004990 [Necator americanus]|uniref:Uncharacterized protein n=1 Tax=Necator americanus TaxID=51031 RepID=A0ABR1BP70_NECAM
MARGTPGYPTASLSFAGHRKEILEDLVSRDESLVLYDSKLCRVWLPRGEGQLSQAKSYMDPKKTLICSFWDSRGMLCANYSRKDTRTPMSFVPLGCRDSRKKSGRDEECCSTSCSLKDTRPRLSSAPLSSRIRRASSRKAAKVSSGTLKKYLNDNTRSHIAKETHQKIEELR